MNRQATLTRRSGTSFARGMTMDLQLDGNDAKVLYERWDRSKWGEPMGFQGGSEAITCDMVLEVPMNELVKVYGKTRAERYLKIATEFAVR